MRRGAFSYVLPEELIAQRPAECRDSSRLLCLDRDAGVFEDRCFLDLPELLRPDDVLVLNDTRVMPARLYGRKGSGGRVEILVERILEPGRMLAQVGASKPPRAGSTILLEGGAELRVTGRREDLYVLETTGAQAVMEILEAAGHIPLPPYIKRPDDAADRDRYQTVFARRPGAVAAPTAGLHFTGSLLEALRQRRIGIGFLTLHVGAGTFQPVRAENIEDHAMHPECFEVSADLCEQIAGAKRRGGRVVAVGTTSVRALESAAHAGELKPVQGETSLFIYPGYRFQVVDALLTNFHLPESTLLMLVCAFAGTGRVLRAYEHAVAERYRFFSYGDAMLIS